MALILADRVKVRAFTSGTGTFTLSDTVVGFRGFNAIGDGNDTFYGIIDSNNNWEIGRGTWSQISNTLTRTLILSSSNNGSLVDFPVGAKTVYSTFPSEAVGDFAYTTSVESTSGGATIRLARTGGENDDIALLGSGDISVTRTDESTITLSANITVTQSAESTSGGAILRLDKGGVTDDVSIIGDDGLIVTRTDANTITLTTDIAQSIEEPSISGTIAYDDFESGTLSAGLWSSSAQITVASTGSGTGSTGGFVSSGGGSTRYVLFGNNGSGERTLTSTARDFRSASALNFRYITGNDSNGGETVDAGENLLVEFSVGGNVFSDTETVPFSPTWANYSVNIPAQFQTSNVYFRFRQANSGPIFDWLGLDSITYTALVNENTVIHRLSRSGAAADDISIRGSSGIDITRDNDSQFTLTAGISQSAESVAGGAIIRMSKTRGANDDIAVTGTNGVAVSRVDANTINIDTTEATGVSIVMGL